MRRGRDAKCFENQMLAYARGAQCGGRIRMEAREFCLNNDKHRVANKNRAREAYYPALPVCIVVYF